MFLYAIYDVIKKSPIKRMNPYFDIFKNYIRT